MKDWKVKIIADSLSSVNECRLTTFQLCYPRLIHSEIMTHRVFSRNAASSRAIPAKKFIRQVWSNPARPVEWGKNRPGMQAREMLTPFKQDLMSLLWVLSSKIAVVFAWMMDKIGAHKQVVNRVLEPYQWIDVVLSATDFQNFFDLRCHEDADPTIRKLACLMKYEYNFSIPVQLQPNEWHLPYIKDSEKKVHSIDVLLKASTARCARVSYQNHDATECNISKDIQLADKLVESKHFSPLEHQARSGTYGNRNFDIGFTQYRALVQIKGIK